MAQFTSPRFIGDTVLEDILNDPDTGTKKLQSGSPAASVTSVQQALFDLGWNLRASPAVEDENAFVDGGYGPATTRTVLNYKIYFDIHFPPTDPFGIYDGFAGPRTLNHLDSHIVLFDEAVDAINTKVSDLQAAGVGVQMPVSNAISERFRIVPAAMGVGHLATIDGAAGTILFKRGVGAFEVHGPIFDTYGHEGGPNDRFGFPTSDEHDDGPGFRRSDFEHGSLRLEQATGQVELLGPASTAPDVVLF
jgi:LGFP repeat